MRIAVLALQGAFAEHERMLQQLGAECFEIRQQADWLRQKDGLLLPGGESTVHQRLLDRLNLLAPIRHDILSGLPVFGTCAGLILLAKQESGLPRQHGLATMDVDVCRNAYGRQLGSFVARGSVEGIGTDVPMNFIRAPYVNKVLSPGVEVLAEVGGRIVAVRQGHQLATAFHPEVSGDVRVHEYFLAMCSLAEKASLFC